MKVKGLIIAVTTMTLAVGCFSGCSSATDDTAEYHWKMALNSSAGDAAYDGAAFFKEKIEEITNGRVEVTLYGGASLGTTSEVLECMPIGVADIMCESVGTLSTFTDLANVDALPYIYSGYDHFMKVWESDLGDEMKEVIGEETNFKLLGNMYRGARIVTATNEMTTPEDMKGFKLRAPNLDVYLKTWQYIGAAPMPLAMSEVYTALQQHTVEGQENPMSDSYNYAFQEVCKYWIKTNHVYSANVFIMDRDYFNSLPEDIQAAAIEASEYASDQMNSLMLDREAETEQKLIDSGCTVLEVDTQEFIDYYADFVDTYYPELSDWANRIKAMDPNLEGAAEQEETVQDDAAEGTV